MLRTTAALAALALAAGAQLRGGDPPIPSWGGNGTTLQWAALVNMTDVADAPDHPVWQFKYFYDGAAKVSRYEHGQGQQDEVCAGVKGQPLGQPCTVINALNGHSYLSWPDSGACCLCADTWTIRADWLQDGGTTYTGRSTQFGQTADGWLKYGASANHYYATADGLQAPIAYREAKNGKLKQWQFLSWAPGVQPDSLFAPPSGACADTPCGSFACSHL